MTLDKSRSLPLCVYAVSVHCNLLSSEISIRLAPLFYDCTSYSIAGNFGGSKFWRIKILANDPDFRFGEFNFGGKSLAHVLLQ